MSENATPAPTSDPAPDPDLDAWQEYLSAARRAVLRHQHQHGLLADPDPVIALIAWTWWARGYDVPPVTALSPSTRPPSGSVPRADAYGLMVLEGMREQVPEQVAQEAVAARMADLATQVVGHGEAGIMPGTPVASVRVSDLVISDGEGGTPATVACPVCRATESIELLWDTQTVSASCPEGHGRWTPRPVCAGRVWDQIRARAGSAS